MASPCNMPEAAGLGKPAQRNPRNAESGWRFLPSLRNPLAFGFLGQESEGETAIVFRTWGNWWSRNVYSLGTNSPEINEGAIVGGGRNSGWL